MLQFIISMIFGLTVGVIMCLILWLNTRLTLTEFVAIVGFVFSGSTVWTFTEGRFADLTLIATLTVWTLGRILFTSKRAFEKLLTFAMSTTLVLNYYIYLQFIGLRVDGMDFETAKKTMTAYLWLVCGQEYDSAHNG